MKRIYAALVALFIVAVGALAFASPASANGGHDDTPSADNKKVEFCHYDGSNNNGGSGKYSKIEVSVSAFYNAGHIDHTNDIWKAFSYTTKGGDTVSVPARGDTSLLAFDKCQAPKIPDAVTVTVKSVDKCGTKNDDVSAVVNPRDGAVFNVTHEGTRWTVDATANEGFVLDLDSSWSAGEGGVFTKVITLSDEDCGLPETGSATNNVAGGIAVLALIGVGATVLLVRRRSA